MSALINLLGDMFNKRNYKDYIINEKYFQKNNKDKLLHKVNEEIDSYINYICDECNLLYNDFLTAEPQIYWNKTIYDEMITNFKTNGNNLIEISVDKNFMEHYLRGKHTYYQIIKQLNEVSNFNINIDTKIRLFYLPIYTTIIESCISNFARAICCLESYYTTKDYTTANTVSKWRDVLRARSYINLTEAINVDIRNAINHGKIDINNDSVCFYYNQSNQVRELKVSKYQVQKLLEDTIDVASAMLLAISTFLNNNNLFDEKYSDYINSQIFAMKISMPGIECKNIFDTGNNKQLNIALDIEDCNKDSIHNIALYLPLIVQNKYPKYEKYMISFHNPRMNTGWIRYTNDEIISLREDMSCVKEVISNIVKRKDFLIHDINKECISETDIKYFIYPIIKNDKYKITEIQDCSMKDRKRLKANLIVFGEDEKVNLINIIKLAINELKYVKNPPSLTESIKHGELAADSLYINVYRKDIRGNKEISISNDNFICKVDYNTSGISTLKQGGIPAPIWYSLTHEKIDNIQIAWREKKYGTVTKGKKIHRNDRCDCGSGKKYKKCCYRSQA